MGSAGLSGSPGEVAGHAPAPAVPLVLLEGLKPDRSFDTIACGCSAAAMGFLGRFAALTGGKTCALLSPQASRLLSSGAALPGIERYETLAVGGDGRIRVEPLRSLLARPEAGDRPSVVLNGAVGPYLCRPLKMGADVVVEDLGLWFPPELLSACGLEGPCLVASWTAERAGGVLAEALPRPFRELDEDRDAVLAAGLATLSMRAQRMSDNALVAAHYLAADERVAWVSYPGLPDDEGNDAARRVLEHGFGPYVAFGLADGSMPSGERGHGAFAGASDAGGAGCDRTVLRRGPLPASFVVRVGLESPLDVVAALDRVVAGSEA